MEWCQEKDQEEGQERDGVTGFDCCQDVYSVPHTYVIIHYAIFVYNYRIYEA